MIAYRCEVCPAYAPCGALVADGEDAPDRCLYNGKEGKVMPEPKWQECHCNELIADLSISDEEREMR